MLFASLWVGIGTAMLVLLVAAIGNRSRQVCTGYKISIKGVEQNFFFADRDILDRLKEATDSKLTGSPVSDFNLRKLESMLEKDVWVEDAELYFDNKNLLHVVVKEREPVARVITTGGQSFYLDSKGVRMPLSNRKTAHVLVFTGFPDKRNWSRKDSALANGVREISRFTMHDPFWKAQAGQVNITDDRNFELIPTIGNHVVQLGSEKNLEEKFHRLFVFYKQVLSKAGMDRYSTIKVQYDKQIVGVRRGEEDVTVDSVQLKMNVQKLMDEARRMSSEPATSISGSVEENKPQPAETGSNPSPENKPKAVMPPLRAGNQ